LKKFKGTVEYRHVVWKDRGKRFYNAMGSWLRGKINSLRLIPYNPGENGRMVYIPTRRLFMKVKKILSRYVDVTHDEADARRLL